MKINTIKLFTLAAISGLCIISCDDGDKIIDEILETTERGAVLRTVDRFGDDYDRFDTSTNFGVTFEEQDVEDGGLLERVDVFANFTDNTPENDDANGGPTAPTEVMVATFPASAFTVGPFGFPRATFESTFQEALDALGVAEGQFDGEDAIFFRFLLTLTDGSSFSSDTNTNTLTGSFFASPFEYRQTVVCIPLAPVPGDYLLELADSMDNGWDGARIQVSIDGELEDFTVPEGEGDAEFTVNVPVGTTEFFFTYIAGNVAGNERQNAYEITAPTGETAIEDGPSPTTGVLVLNICDG